MCETCLEHALLHTPEEIDEAVSDPQAHWDNLEDRKAGLREVESRLQGQSTLDECVEEYVRGSAERAYCMANLAWMCAVENLPLHIGTQPGFVKFMRKWEPQWPSISKQSMTKLVGCQIQELQEAIKKEMEGVATETDIAFTTDFWDEPDGRKLHDDEYALDNTGLAFEDTHLGDDKFPTSLYCCEHLKQDNGFASKVWGIS